MANVRLKQVKKSYDGKTAVLDGIDLDIHDGEFVVLVGPSGCGKSTLLRMLCGLESITAGTLEIGDRVVNDLTPAERGIAMVFQSYALYPHMTVYKNMSFGLKIAGQGRDAIDTRVRQAAATLKIDHLLDRYPRELSGGQRQRVAIGRAIVREPRLFLFDEPLSNLDAELRVQTRQEIARLQRQLKATIVYVTHDQIEAMTLGDRIVVMHDGRIQQVGTPLDLYRRPHNRFVATFIGSPRMNLLPARIDTDSSSRLTVAGNTLELSVSDWKLPDSGRIEIGFRAENALPAGPEARGLVLHGTVLTAEHLGEHQNVYLQLGDGTEIVTRCPSGIEVRSGQDWAVNVGLDTLHAFDDNGLSLRS
jgi:multiple sugar transport system ATP-binding protein